MSVEFVENATGRDEEFDVILVKDTIKHIPPHQGLLIRNLKNILSE